LERARRLAGFEIPRHARQSVRRGDVVSETIARMLAARVPLETVSDARLRTWTRKVVQELVRQERRADAALRKLYASQHVDLDVRAPPSEPDFPTTSSSGSPDPNGPETRRALLAEFFARLSPKLAAALELYLDGVTTRRAAELLGIHRSSYRSRLTLAHSKLQGMARSAGRAGKVTERVRTRSQREFRLKRRRKPPTHPA
jgi:DNA-directed RNA polymerase specialized sigma24 family protein